MDSKRFDPGACTRGAWSSRVREQHLDQPVCGASFCLIPRGAPLHVYRVTLTGRAETPHGAANGTGDAVIAIHRGSIVCWRFVHLRGFRNATAAHIHAGARGKAGSVLLPLSTGARLHHRGCVQASRVAVTAIERDPPGYFVSIHSLQYPAGAVRAQL